MGRFIGLDAHTQTCTLAVIGPSGKRLHEQVLATDAQMLRAAIEKIGGRRHLCMEEVEGGGASRPRLARMPGGAATGSRRCAAYRAKSFRWGPSGGVPIDTEWHGPPPPIDARLRIRSRAARDQNPLSVADPAQRLQLRSYIWADQHDRLARFDAAADLAIATAARVERADAATWVEERLAHRAKRGATIVYHSVFLQYPPPATRAAIAAAIEAAGERVTADAPLGWLRLEPEALLTGPRESIRFLVELITWPGAVRRLLAITDGHARTVHACEDGSRGTGGG